jgi:hypothetical protein
LCAVLRLVRNAQHSSVGISVDVPRDGHDGRGSKRLDDAGMIILGGMF